jgi:hypothetical protein
VRTVPVFAAAALIAMSAAVSACGQTSPPTSLTGPASSQAHSGCGRATPVSPASKTFTVGNDDNGKAFCVKRGTAVLVYLHGSADRKWAPIHATGGVLEPRANGRLMVVLGTTGASFVAAHPGETVISSARPACAQGKGSPGTMHCGAMLGFRTTLIVH